MKNREEFRQKGHDKSKKNDVSREGKNIFFSGDYLVGWATM
jgi:hypothetical protein